MVRLLEIIRVGENLAAGMPLFNAHPAFLYA